MLPGAPHQVVSPSPLWSSIGDKYTARHDFRGGDVSSVCPISIHGEPCTHGRYPDERREGDRGECIPDGCEALTHLAVCQCTSSDMIQIRGNLDLNEEYRNGSDCIMCDGEVDHTSD